MLTVNCREWPSRAIYNNGGCFKVVHLVKLPHDSKPPLSPTKIFLIPYNAFLLFNLTFNFFPNVPESPFPSKRCMYLWSNQNLKVSSFSSNPKTLINKVVTVRRPAWWENHHYFLCVWAQGGGGEEVDNFTFNFYSFIFQFEGYKMK